MSLTAESIVNAIPQNRESLLALREILLANALMIGEIPAPTFEEDARITFISNRFTELGLQNISIDEAGNGMAMIPGTKGRKNLLICAHADTVFNSKIDHAMSVGPDTIQGPGIGDNSLGLAAIATLPEILDHLDIQLEDNIILLACTQSLGRGDLGGMRFFLENNQLPLRSAICVEGIQLGRLAYTSIGMLRGEITVDLPPDYDWNQFGAAGSVVLLNKVVQRIMEIPIPMEPPTRIHFGSMNAGTSYGTEPTTATLRFEIRSEKVGMAAEMRQKIEAIIDEIATHSDTAISLSVIAQRTKSGLDYSHPMVQTMRSILKKMKIKPQDRPSVGELSALIKEGIPGVTIGLTKGRDKNELKESIVIDPIFDGLSQLVALVQSIDGGFCDGR